MPTTVIIPVKSFSLGKRRLSQVLTPEMRGRLGRGLAEHVASTVTSAGQLPVIVTADPEVAQWSTRAGFPSLADPGRGLDEAARTGVEWALHTAGAWMVLHSDLPLLGVDDVRHLGVLLEERGSVIAPSSDGGTSAIGSEQPVRFSFGASSFHRHLLRLSDPGVVARAGLLHDLDSPDDLISTASTLRGRWIEELVGPI